MQCVFCKSASGTSIQQNLSDKNFEPEPKATGDGTLFLSFRECTNLLPLR